MFGTYLQLGFEHILDLNGYDHLLFLVALCAVFPPSAWRKVVVLVTAFTIGHCLTLALSGLNVINPPSDLIEFLIPLTIFITAIYNISSSRHSKSFDKVQYGIVGVFGLIHGMGFSNYFKALLGNEGEVVKALLAFNIGVELGQLVIIAVILCITYVVF